MGLDVSDFLADLGMEKDSTEMVKSVGDCAVIASGYLLRVGEYTAKKKKNSAVKVGRYIFVCQDSKEYLHQLPINALDEEIFWQMEQL